MVDPNASCVSPSDLEAGTGYTGDSTLSEKALLTRSIEQTSVSGHGSIHDDIIGAHAKSCTYFQFTTTQLGNFVAGLWRAYQTRSKIRHNRKTRIIKSIKHCKSKRKQFALCANSNLIVESYPLGFPKAAAFLNSDDQFMVYRRFGVLFSRLLLRKQDELLELEERLHDMDEIDNRKQETKQYLRNRDADDRRESKPWNESRTEVLDKIEQKALEYSK